MITIWGVPEHTTFSVVYGDANAFTARVPCLKSHRAIPAILKEKVYLAMRLSSVSLDIGHVLRRRAAQMIRKVRVRCPDVCILSTCALLAKRAICSINIGHLHGVPFGLHTRGDRMETRNMGNVSLNIA